MPEEDQFHSLVATTRSNLEIIGRIQIEQAETFSPAAYFKSVGVQYVYAQGVSLKRSASVEFNPIPLCCDTLQQMMKGCTIANTGIDRRKMAIRKRQVPTKALRLGDGQGIKTKLESTGISHWKIRWLI